MEVGDLTYAEYAADPVLGRRWAIMSELKDMVRILQQVRAHFLNPQMDKLSADRFAEATSLWDSACWTSNHTGAAQYPWDRDQLWHLIAEEMRVAAMQAWGCAGAPFPGARHGEPTTLTRAPCDREKAYVTACLKVAEQLRPYFAWLVPPKWVQREMADYALYPHCETHRWRELATMGDYFIGEVISRPWALVYAGKAGHDGDLLEARRHHSEPAELGSGESKWMSERFAATMHTVAPVAAFDRMRLDRPRFSVLLVDHDQDADPTTAPTSAKVGVEGLKRAQRALWWMRAQVDVAVQLKSSVMLPFATLQPGGLRPFRFTFEPSVNPPGFETWSKPLVCVATHQRALRGERVTQLFDKVVDADAQRECDWQERNKVVRVLQLYQKKRATVKKSRRVTEKCSETFHVALHTLLRLVDYNWAGNNEPLRLILNMIGQREDTFCNYYERRWLLMHELRASPCWFHRIVLHPGWKPEPEKHTIQRDGNFLKGKNAYGLDLLSAQERRWYEKPCEMLFPSFA